MICSYVSISHVTPSVSVLLYRYTTSRNMRSTIAFLKKNILTSGVARLPDKVAHLSLGNDQPSEDSSSSNVVSRRIPRNITINRNRTQIMPKSVLGSHMSYVCNYMKNIRSEAHFKVNPPVMTFPHGLIDCLFESQRTTFMGLGYRFNPGQSEFIMHNARFPSSLMNRSYSGYTGWMNSLHLSMSKKMSSVRELCSFSRQDGMRSVLDLNYYKNLVEVITLFNGTYGRFLILTCSGFGCTVWYTFFPCIDGQAPMELFTPIVSYDPLLNMEFLDPSYNCVEFTAQKDMSERIKSTFVNVPPFSEMNIPASGVVLRNVCLGLMIAFIITTGVVDMSNVMNNV